MVELVDAEDSKSSGLHALASSSLASGTNNIKAFSVSVGSLFFGSNSVFVQLQPILGHAVGKNTCILVSVQTDHIKFKIVMVSEISPGIFKSRSDN